jgi:CRP-like cAMP-binding protein
MQRKTVGRDGAERLASIELFSELNPGQRSMLARMLDELTADPGEELMREGDYGYEVIFIEEGAAEVRRDGRVINEVGPGETLGELAVLDAGGRRTASVLVAEPLRAIVLTSNAMHQLRRQMPDVAEAIDRVAEAHRERDRRRRGEQPSS